MNDIDRNRQLALQIMACFETGDLDGLDQVISERAVGHDTESQNLLRLPSIGSESARAFISSFRTAFNDLHFSVEHVVAERDLVAVRAVMTGTHNGQFFHLPPSGRTVRVTGVDIDRFSDGKLVEHWGLWDRMSLLQQLGVVNIDQLWNAKRNAT